jgi:hypothetical protein
MVSAISAAVAVVSNFRVEVVMGLSIQGGRGRAARGAGRWLQ